MYDVSETWASLMENDLHWFEQSVVIGETGVLINESGNTITFGGNAILVAQANAGSGLKGEWIFELSIERRAFSSEQPSVGACLSAEINLRILRPPGNIPRMALVAPYIRVTDGTTNSEWIPQGKFFIDTRTNSRNDDSLDIVTIHGYDAMLKTEQDYPDTTHAWPMSDIDVVNEIATAIGVGVDARTAALMTNDYQISAPAGYSMREVLGNIAAMYAGNWVMNYDGDLLLVTIDSYPPETSYIVTDNGSPITFGGDRILVNAV